MEGPSRQGVHTDETESTVFTIFRARDTTHDPRLFLNCGLNRCKSCQRKQSRDGPRALHI